MPKYSPVPKPERLPSDGAIPPELMSDELHDRGGGDVPEDPRTMVFQVADLDYRRLAAITEGTPVTLDPTDDRVAVQIGRHRLGVVPRRYRRSVREAIAAGTYAAWISRVADRSAWVRVRF